MSCYSSPHKDSRFYCFITVGVCVGTDRNANRASSFRIARSSADHLSVEIEYACSNIRRSCSICLSPHIIGRVGGLCILDSAIAETVLLFALAKI